MTQATVTVNPIRDAVICITVTGEIDLSNAPAVERQILDAISNDLGDVALDLSPLDYIDSAGLRLLFTLGTRLKTLQINLTLVVPTHSLVRRMIDLAGVAGHRQVDAAITVVTEPYLPVTRLERARQGIDRGLVGS